MHTDFHWTPELDLPLGAFVGLNLFVLLFASRLAKAWLGLVGRRCGEQERHRLAKSFRFHLLEEKPNHAGITRALFWIGFFNCIAVIFLRIFVLPRIV